MPLWLFYIKLRGEFNLALIWLSLNETEHNTHITGPQTLAMLILFKICNIVFWEWPLRYFTYLQIYSILSSDTCPTFPPRREMNKNGEEKNKTHRACTHNTLVTLLGWEEVALVEGLSRLINSSVVPAGFDRSSESCGDSDLVTWSGPRKSARWTPGIFSPSLILVFGWRSDLCILDNTAEALLPGSRTTKQDTWLCCISRGPSAEKTMWITPIANRPHELLRSVNVWNRGWTRTSVQTQRMQNMSPKGFRWGCQLSPGL